MASRTMLHHSTIAAMGGARRMRLRGHVQPVFDIARGYAVSPHPVGLGWHTHHNMLGLDNISGLTIMHGRVVGTEAS